MKSRYSELSQEFYLKEEMERVASFEHQESNSSTISSCYKSTSSIREVVLIPNDAVYDLRCIVERMICAGYLRECIQVDAIVVQLFFSKSELLSLTVSKF